AFKAAAGKPVAIRNLAVVAAVGHHDGAAVLLRSIGVIRKLVIRGDVVQLARRLVEPIGPGGSSVQTDDCTLVRADNHAIGTVGSDPQNMMVFAAGRATPRDKRLAAVA